jgi:anti-anti-sigma factor
MRGRLGGVEFEEREGALVARVEGEIDGSNTLELGRALTEQLPSASRGLVLDLHQVGYLDSAGIELLFDLARRLRTHRQRLGLVVPDDAPMRRVLDLCDIEQAASVEPTVEAALNGMARAES